MVLENTVHNPSSAKSNDNDDVDVDDTEGGVVLLEANANRKSALIMNTGTSSMRVTTDGSDPTETRGKLLIPNGSLVLSSPGCPTNAVKAICANGESTTANPSEVE